MRSSKVFQEISTELLARGHGMRFRAEGKSMQPTIREGEAITVEPVAPWAVKRGDILLCRGPQGFIAHRVVRIQITNGSSPAQSSALSSHYSFILRGDALSGCDAPVESGQVLGKVVSVERDGRRIYPNSRKAKLIHNLRVGVLRLARLGGIKPIFHFIRRLLAPLVVRSG